jgi:hypothetical protein
MQTIITRVTTTFVFVLVLCHVVGCVTEEYYTQYVQADELPFESPQHVETASAKSSHDASTFATLYEGNGLRRHNEVIQVRGTVKIVDRSGYEFVESNDAEQARSIGVPFVVLEGNGSKDVKCFFSSSEKASLQNLETGYQQVEIKGKCTGIRGNVKDPAVLLEHCSIVGEPFFPWWYNRWVLVTGVILAILLLCLLARVVIADYKENTHTEEAANSRTAGPRL